MSSLNTVFKIGYKTVNENLVEIVTKLEITANILQYKKMLSVRVVYRSQGENVSKLVRHCSWCESCPTDSTWCRQGSHTPQTHPAHQLQ